MCGFSNSDGILSDAAALPSLIFLVAILISSIVNEVTSMGKCVCATSISGGFNGADLFKNVLKLFSSSVPLFLNSSGWLAFFVLDQSLSKNGGLIRFPLIIQPNRNDGLRIPVDQTQQPLDSHIYNQPELPGQSRNDVGHSIPDHHQQQQEQSTELPQEYHD
ncbi:unnamed protein product, partial [Schistosoma mattheei]